MLCIFYLQPEGFLKSMLLYPLITIKKQEERTKIDNNISPAQRRNILQSKPNRNYKDTVFRLLFKEPAHALSLYNSLNGTSYTDTALLHFNTLENAIYMNFKNDISFLIAHHISLYEHQSTFNPNMPLRNLFYISDIMQEYVSSKSLYGPKLIQLPSPVFIVFYNGLEPVPEYSEMKLSDAYEFPEDSPALDLKVRVLNINPGMNEDLKRKCPVLQEYMMYVEQVRYYRKNLPLADAVNHVVEDCISNNILKEFLYKQKSEVVKVSIYEYDEEKEIRLFKQAEREYAMELARKEVTEEVTENVTKEVTENVTKSVTESVTKSVTESVTKSVTAAAIETLIRTLQEFHIDDQLILQKLIEKYCLTEEEARTALLTK